MAGKKLLVVDDSLTIQKVIRLALSNEGYEIQASSDGNDALQQIALFRPDVVLIDVSLPGQSAFQVKSEINRQGDLAHVRFVLMSSAFEQVDEKTAAEVHFHARLIKPFDPAHLRQVLTDALATVSPAAPPSEPVRPTAKTESASLSADLWDKESREALGQSLPPAHLGGGPSLDADDSDIRKLTESTIKMSGLDELQWSVNETARKEIKAPLSEPAIEPHPQLADTGESRFKFDPDMQLPEMHVTDNRYGDLPITPPPPQGEQREPTHTTLTRPQATQAVPQAQMAPVSSGDVEEAVRRHLEGTLERMAQKMLPDLAEKIIRQEIHKMLSEQP
jgi:two-component system cell cycle response regulator